MYRKQTSLSDKTLVGGNTAFAFHLQWYSYSRYRLCSLLVQSGWGQLSGAVMEILALQFACLFSGKTFTWKHCSSFLQKFWESSKTNTCTTCKTKSKKLIQYVLHPVKASLYPWAEGKYDEQDTFVFIPIPRFFGKINHNLKLQKLKDPPAFHASRQIQLSLWCSQIDERKVDQRLEKKMINGKAENYTFKKFYDVQAILKMFLCPK